MRIASGEREQASILHADLDSFYASVEQRDDPSLRGRPVLVGGGVVVAASYEAKALGVRCPMPGHEARALVPRAVTVSPRFEAYTQASRDVFDIFHDVTPLVEGISVDEAFLDVGGLGKISGTPVAIAERLRRRVRDDVGLPITVGVATSKFVAKVASAAGKPDGLLHIVAGKEVDFLHPLPVRSLWGVGAKTEQRLRDAGIETVGQMASLGEDRLGSLLGRSSGRHLYSLAMARDPRRVTTGRRRSSIGAQRALGRRIKAESDIEATLVGIVDGLGRRLRSADRLTRTIVLRLRFHDFERVTRSRSMFEPTDGTETILAVARGLLDEAMPLIRERGCTLIGLSLTNLSDHGAVQLAIPFDGDDHAGELDVTIDSLRTRFGKGAVTRGVLVGRRAMPDTPMLPD
ncbi:DNA polymerase IV [Gordonia sp. (in: high G+C Gram-positive bacteria)]|uniref:DNA polymerase IV n=1 Tax=Gordonia sp. (in: high G+C Gram-positive bacteria) TaxID=84139 RepID=UPI0016B74448|nr:DNA polymerase IV [Gordonia sp. (in: high G+C Gram-positive bacteria)]NLG47736.1 DNA polymerase IV [Gordonia sp. (in: high G+C Gram-positive bacteria)]